MIPEGQNGCLSLYGDDPIVHSNFADHILAEVFQSEFVEGKGLKEGWKQLHERNHWLDTAGGNIVAAEMLGITVLGRAVVKKKKVKMSDRIAAKRAGKG